VASRTRENGAHPTDAPGLPGSGPYFASVAVQGVRCFGPEQRLSLLNGAGLPARWTVLLGENGVGKTTLLQLMALLASPDSREVEHMLEFEMFEWFHEWRRPRRPPRRPDLGGSLSRGGERGHAMATFRRGGEDFVHEIAGGRSGPWEGKQAHERAPFLCGYGANRRLGEGGLKRRGREADAFLSLFTDIELRDAEEWLLQADYAAARENDDAKARRRVEVVKELLLRVLPDSKGVRISPTKMDYPTAEVETPYGWVPVRDLSLGYQTMIAWMVDLASRFLDRFSKHADPLAQPAVVLVDEIDLHLHPTWQRQLMGYLEQRFPATQFIATAHSPLVVQAAAEANVAVLRRDGDHVRIEAQPDEIRTWRVDQILTSDLYGLPSARSPALDALLTERREILAKGELKPADKRRLRFLETKIGGLPGGETPETLRAMELIQRAATALEKPRRARR